MNEELEMKVLDFYSIVETHADLLVKDLKSKTTYYGELLHVLNQTKYHCKPFNGNEQSRFYLIVIERARELVKEEMAEVRFTKEEK